MRTGQGKAYRGAGLSLLFAAAAGVCLAQMPPSDSVKYAAKAIELTGQVSVLRDATPWALNVGDMVQVRELIITGADGQARFQVSDGSTFDVYPNSRVVFRKNPPNWKDLLDVLVGRVKVHIQHLYGPNPNRVQTPTAVISVRGTTFDVSVEDEDETTTIEVEEGIVEVQHALLPRGNPKTLTTGESIKVYRNEPIASGRVNKGELAWRIMRAAIDAIDTYEARLPKGGTVGVSTGSGDTGNKLPPPPPVAAPPPPPPAPGRFVETDNGPAVTVMVVPNHQTRMQKVRHAVWVAVKRFALGPDPGFDVQGHKIKQKKRDQHH